MKIIYNENFDESEMLNTFKNFLIEEHKKREIKRGKLFEFYLSPCGFHLRNIDLLISDCSLYYNKSRKLEKECLKVLSDVLKEYNTNLEIIPTEGTAKLYKIYRI